MGLLGELVAGDEWGFPIIKAAKVPTELESYAREAAKACPRKALQLVPERA
jgi:ferredoxin